MANSFKLNKITAIILALTVTTIGAGVMSLTSVTNAQPDETSSDSVSALSEFTVPGAGMGSVMEDYFVAVPDRSVELLSTTALGASLEGKFNEYYDKNGSTIGKLIVYNEKEDADVYDAIPGTERIEVGEAEAKIAGHLQKGDVATLVSVQGDWYQIISGSLNGYVNKAGFVRGIEAEKLDDDTYVRMASAKNKNVYMYAEDDESSMVLCVLPKNVQFTLLKKGDTLSKIRIPGVGKGWVVNKKIKISKERRYGETTAEEKESKKKIKAGVKAAEKVEEQRAAEAAQDELEEAVKKINIKPGKPDSDDVKALREALVAYAQQFVGILPYVYGGADLTSGADCSGFTMAVYAAFGISIPRVSGDQAWGGTSVPIEDIRLGDIVCYSGHVAIYIGNGMVVHEPVPGEMCSIASMNMMPIINIARYIN